MHLDDILTDSILQADDNNLWHVKFTKNLTDFDLDSLVEIPDTIIKKILSPNIFGGPFTVPPGTVLVSLNENNEFDVNSVELKEVIAKSGYLEYSVKSYVNGYLSCEYSIPGLSNNGQSVEINVATLPSLNHVPSVVSGSIDLTDYTLDLTGENGFQSNTLFSHILVKTTPGAPADAIVYGTDSVVVELKFVDPKVKYARGYFGQHTYQLDELADFGYNMPSGSIDIDQVSMRFQIENFVGVDAQIKFNLISSLNQQVNTQVDLNNAGIYQEWNITRALNTGGVVQPTYHETQLDEANSNLDLFIENLPNAIHVIGDVKINPLGDVSAGNDFIFTDNALNAVMDIDLPLSIGMQALTLKDTLLLSQGLEELNADGVLHLYIENSFPLETVVDVHVLGADGNFLSTLLDNGTVSPGIETVDPGITLPVRSVIDILITPAQAGQLIAGNQVVISATFNTANYPDHVGLYTAYYIDYVLTTDAHAEISFQ